MADSENKRKQNDEVVEMMDAVVTTRRGSVSSVRSEKSLDSTMSASASAGKGSKKRRLVELRDDVKEDDYVLRMKRIGDELRKFLLADTNKVSKNATEFILGMASEYELLINNVLHCNERLKGRLEEKELFVERPMTGAMIAPVSGLKGTVDGAGTFIVPEKALKEKVSYAVVVKSASGVNDKTSEQVKMQVMKHVQPKLNVRVRAVRKIRNGGLAIETMSESERTKIRECKVFEGLGLKVELPRKIGPKIIVYDVPNTMTEDKFMSDLFERNLQDMISMKEFKERVRIVRRYSKKGTNCGNVIVELPTTVYSNVIRNGRLYIEWNAFKVREYVDVTRCFACMGYGHMMKECKVGKLCRKCGETDHVMKECNKTEVCMNCKTKKLPWEHSVMSVRCPEYVRVLENAKKRISND